MRSLIRTEWLKMRKYNAFWWILGVTALSYPGINYMFYQGYEEIIGHPNQAGQYVKTGPWQSFYFSGSMAYGCLFFLVFLFLFLL